MVMLSNIDVLEDCMGLGSCVRSRSSSVSGGAERGLGCFDASDGVHASDEEVIAEDGDSRPSCPWVCRRGRSAWLSAVDESEVRG